MEVSLVTGFSVVYRNAL